MTQKKYQRALFIFRRDLRLIDNNGLHAALMSSQQVIPCFILDPVQIGVKNQYRSTNALEFMAQSLQDLDDQLRDHNGHLYIMHGKTETVVQKLLTLLAPDALFCNRDYTPFSQQRDAVLANLCKKHECEFVPHNDLLLTEPEEMINSAHKPFSIFTAFFNKARQVVVPEPKKRINGTFFTQKIPTSLTIKELFALIAPRPNKALYTAGGRKQGLLHLKHIGTFKKYDKERDFPSIATTALSAHLKFGTLSIREVYHQFLTKLGHNNPLIRQLYWRDYYTHIAFHYPHVFGHACQKKYATMRWSNNKRLFAAWCQGMTGFPIIDAGMRQLNITGFMHNRVRMLVASFLTKDLHIDWRWGERYFAQKLVDYDPSVNNGNWQWVSSTGCCAMPYFRIFNPWLQQKKYDPQCTYIKEWIPELHDSTPSAIHTLFKQRVEGYPAPIIDHTQEAAKTKQYMRTIRP